MGLVRHFVDDMSKGLPEPELDRRRSTLKQNCQYTFETKISFLTSLTLTDVGARVVVDNGVLGYLEKMELPSYLFEYFSPRSIGPLSKPIAFSLVERLLSTILRLLSTLLMSFPKSEEVVRCASQFLDRNYEVLGVILKDAVGWVSVQSLGLLEAVVSVVYLVCRTVMVHHFEYAQYYRVRILMLLVKYLSPEWCRYVYGVLSSHQSEHSVSEPPSTYSFKAPASFPSASSFSCPLPIVDSGPHPLQPPVSMSAHLGVCKAVMSLHLALLACSRAFLSCSFFQDSLHPTEPNFFPIFSSDLDPQSALERASDGPSLGLCISFLQICAQQMIPFEVGTVLGKSFNLILEHLLALIWLHLDFSLPKNAQFSRNDLLYQAEESVLKHPPYREASGPFRFVQLIIDKMREIRFASRTNSVHKEGRTPNSVLLSPA